MAVPAVSHEPRFSVQNTWLLSFQELILCSLLIKWIRREKKLLMDWLMDYCHSWLNPRLSRLSLFFSRQYFEYFRLKTLGPKEIKYLLPCLSVYITVRNRYKGPPLFPLDFSHLTTSIGTDWLRATDPLKYMSPLDTNYPVPWKKKKKNFTQESSVSCLPSYLNLSVIWLCFVGNLPYISV